MLRNIVVHRAHLNPVGKPVGYGWFYHNTGHQCWPRVGASLLPPIVYRLSQAFQVLLYSMSETMVQLDLISGTDGLG